MTDNSNLKIKQKLFKITHAIEGMEKSGTSKTAEGGLKYKFMTAEQIKNAVKREAESENVFIKVTELEVLDIATPKAIKRVKLQVEFTDLESGESIIVEGSGDGTDTADKGIYKANTGALKYILCDTFLIATDDDPENAPDDDKENKTSRITIAERVIKEALAEPKEQFPEDIKNWFLMQWTNSPDKMIAICNDNELKPVSKHEMENYQKWVAANAVKCPDKLISIYKGAQNG